MNLLLIINYLIWIYDALTYDRRIKEMNIDDVLKDLSQQYKPLVLLISLIPYASLIDLLVRPIMKKYFNL